MDIVVCVDLTCDDLCHIRWCSSHLMMYITLNVFLYLKMTPGGHCSVCVFHVWWSLSHLMMYITHNVFWCLKMTPGGYCSVCVSHMWSSLSHLMMFITCSHVYHAQHFSKKNPQTNFQFFCFMEHSFCQYQYVVQLEHSFCHILIFCENIKIKNVARDTHDVYHAQRFLIFENDSWWTL